MKAFFCVIGLFLVTHFASSQNLDDNDPDNDGVINRLTPSTNPDRDNLPNTYDLDKDNDGIINALENCDYTGLIEYDEVEVSPLISDLFVRVDGIEIGKVTVTIMPDPSADLLKISNPRFIDGQDAIRSPQLDILGVRWYFGTGTHDGSSVKFDVELYDDYSYYANDIKFYLFGGSTVISPRRDIDDFEIESTTAFTITDTNNELNRLDARGGNVVGSADGLLVPANTVQWFRHTTNRTNGADDRWFLSTNGTLGSSNDGLVKTTSVTYTYTSGSDQSEPLAFAVFLGNTNCVSSSDTDTDTVPNAVDLDADNDACPDAYEYDAVLPTVSLTNERLIGPSGTNGLINTLETSDTQSLPSIGLTYTGSDFDSDNNLVPDHIEALTNSNCHKTSAGTALSGNDRVGKIGISTAVSDSYFKDGTVMGIDVVAKGKGIALPEVSNANLPATATPGTILWNTDEQCLMLWHTDNGSASPGWACVQRANN